MDVLVDLSQEHALESVELSRHLLGEVLEVGRLDHLQSLTDKEVNKRGLTLKPNCKLFVVAREEGSRKKRYHRHSVLDRAIITGEKQTNCSVFIKK